MDKTHFRSASGVIIRNVPRLAAAIEREFVKRISELEPLTPDDFENLGIPPLYFAFGSNMKVAQIKSRCSGTCEFVCIGVLYGWRLDFNVYAEHYKKVVAGITETGIKSDVVYGVIWKITDHDLQRLKEIEEGGYVRRKLSINMKGQGSIYAYVFVPDVTRAKIPENATIEESYVDTLVSGAKECGIGDEVIDEVSKARERFSGSSTC